MNEFRQIERKPQRLCIFGFCLIDTNQAMLNLLHNLDLYSNILFFKKKIYLIFNLCMDVCARSHACELRKPEV